MFCSNIYGKLAVASVFFVILCTSATPSSASVLKDRGYIPSQETGFLSPSALEILSSYEDDLLKDVNDLQKDELLELLREFSQRRTAKRALDYLYGGVRYRKRRAV